MPKIEQIINEIKEMKVADLNRLVKAIETEFGVTAAAPVAAAAAAPTGPVEKTVKLIDAGANKVGVIKVVRDVLGLGLMEAKAFTEKTPNVIKEHIPAEKAEEIKKLFEAAGAKVEVK